MNSQLTLASASFASWSMKTFAKEVMKIRQLKAPTVTNLPHRNTLSKYVKKSEALVIQKADLKPKSRKPALENIRNQLSYCAMQHVLQKHVRKELIFSSDDVSVLINQFDKPKVLTTKEAMNHLAAHNLGVSTTSVEKLQERVATFNCTISADFELLCKIIKIVDKEFFAYKNRPAIFYMGDHLYVMMYCYGMSETLVNYYMYVTCIIPETEYKRKRLVTMKKVGLVDIAEGKYDIKLFAPITIFNEIFPL